MVPQPNQDALPLPHIQHRRRHIPRLKAPGVEQQAGAQRSQAGTDRGLPSLLPPVQQPQEQQDIDEQQPGQIVEGAGAQCREGGPGQPGHHPVQIADKGEHRESQHPAQFRQHCPRRSSDQPAAEGRRHGPQGHQISQGGDQGQAPEIEGRQRRGEHHGPQGGGQGRRPEADQRPQQPERDGVLGRPLPPPQHPLLEPV